MRKHRKFRSGMRICAKRIVSALLVAGMTAALLPAISENGTSYAAESDGQVTRGVVNELGQLPQYQNIQNQAAERGTSAHPFVVLEVVPYEEYAEFGYLIGGCEPVSVEEMVGRGEITTIGSLNDATITSVTAYFFQEEAGSDASLYDYSQLAEWGEYSGYYELAEEGTGTFRRETNADGNTVIVRDDGGDLVWHTAVSMWENGSCIWYTTDSFEKLEDCGNFTDRADKELVNPGDRIYTTRAAGAADPVRIVYNYYIYKNKELFLTKSLGLSEEEAAAYSIVVKTITPDELNRTPEWVDYADLIYFSPKSHVGGLTDIWKKYNRLGKTSAVTSYAKNAFETNDLSWDTALRFYNKITSETDFAAVIIDDNIFNTQEGVITGGSSKNVTMKVFDWNLRQTDLTYNFTGSSNNLYKLIIMLLAMDSNLFKQLYLSGDDPVIQNGVNTLQEKAGYTDAANYWGVETFFLMNTNIDLSKYGNSLYGYWCSEELWKNYHSTTTITNDKYWVNDHIYTYPGNTSISQSYNTGIISSGNAGTKFTDFYEYLSEEERNHATSAEAVRYILGIGKDTETEGAKTLRVLDLEPSVGLAADSSPDWVLTETYIRMLVPSFKGDIEIVHQTTAEFNGKTEDLNSTYQMIFLGLDYGAYNTANKTIQLNSGSWVTLELPDWNDNSLDGKIYLHTGDSMVSTEAPRSSRTGSVKFLWSVASNSVVDSADMRFPGNDISRRKMAELDEYTKSGAPIVAESYLYNLEKNLIDEKSNIYAFVKGHTPAGSGTGVYSIADISGIAGAVRTTASVVTFTTLPAEYNGATDNSTSAAISNPNYLPMSGGKSYLPFEFSVSQSGYSYRIYVDQDKNSKFTEDEVVLSHTADVGSNYYTYRIASSWVGLVQWKIEVYQNGNEAVRYVETGCSAVKNTTGAKKQVNVLQIMPKEGSYDGMLDLETNELFKKYYQNLEDYDITVTSITADEYESYFDGAGFSYDVSQEISATNPVNADRVGGNLSGYNMIIVGFGDTYGSRNLSNSNGAVDYLKYYTDSGKSILFTHDLTSMYNLPNNGVEPFGYTANALLRDTMGMNRYQAVSNQLSEADRNELIAYQAAHADDYDTIDGEEKHGFTYYAMKRLGWSSDANNANSSNRVPFRYMITSPNDGPVCRVNNTTITTGFNNNNDLTTRAAKLNEGQITVYPYKIDDSLEIAQTHGQWYQLSMEDEEVTVWYTLADDGGPRGWDGDGANNGYGTALTYAVSPNDAANNYYIYSKGNIFYSGVGHSTVTGDMEAKLFVNTMIAAYRSAYEPPVVEITNPEAVLSSSQSYTIELMQEFDNAVSTDGTNRQTAEVFTEADTYTVTFSPIELNLVTTNLECKISYIDGTEPVYITTITRVSDGAVLTADPVTHKFSGLQNGQEYSFLYYKRYLSEWQDSSGATHNALRTILFEVNNDRSAGSGTTTLDMTVQPLFQLD